MNWVMSQDSESAFCFWYWCLWMSSNFINISPSTQSIACCTPCLSRRSHGVPILGHIETDGSRSCTKMACAYPKSTSPHRWLRSCVRDHKAIIEDLDARETFGKTFECARSIPGLVNEIDFFQIKKNNPRQRMSYSTYWLVGVTCRGPTSVWGLL